MKLIADSGSTKTEWVIIDNKNNYSQSHLTEGINPYYQNIEDIKQLLNKQFTINIKSFDEIHFYGAGCNNAGKNSIVKDALSSVFKSPQINIYSDLMAASHATCGQNPGISCILGTGSNSCFFNGKTIEKNISPLGYILGDEGSGATIGKILIADILKNQLSKSTIELFFKEHKDSEAEILDRIYKKPFPNRYLAQFSKFIHQHIELKELELIVVNAFKEFIKRNLLQYAEIEKYPIHFIGSIAYHFEEQLIKALNFYNLHKGIIIKSPTKGLVKFYNDGI